MIINDFPMNSEYWRSVDGFPKYEISTDGRVRNSKTGRIMKLQVMPNGYIRVGLKKDKTDSKHSVHRLVATAFCNKTDGCDIVDHIDRNKANNNFQNLRWTTISGNARNRTIHNRNRSGTTGVIYNKKGKWIANWYDEDMQQQSKSFSVNKYGDDQAKQKAITHRKQMAETNGYFNV